MASIKKLFTAILVLGYLSSPAQQILQRFSLNAGFGNHFNLAADDNNLSLGWSSRISFTPMHLFMIEAEYMRGELNGAHVGVSNNSNKKEPYYTTYQYSGIITSLNLIKLFKPGKAPRKFIPYVYAGFGYLNFRSILHQNDNANSTNTYNYNVYTNTLGCKVRYKLSAYLDLLVAVEDRLPQTYYLDANPEESKYDNFIALKVELCYKITCNAKREYIEWLAKPRKVNCPN